MKKNYHTKKFLRTQKLEKKSELADTIKSDFLEDSHHLLAR